MTKFKIDFTVSQLINTIRFIFQIFNVREKQICQM